MTALKNIAIAPNSETLALFSQLNQPPFRSGLSLFELLKRQGMDLPTLSAIVAELAEKDKTDGSEEEKRLLKNGAAYPEIIGLLTKNARENLIPADIVMELETQAKYEGYIEKQRQQIDRMHRLEEKKFPAGFDFRSLAALSEEAREKLAAIAPETIGRAARISGVSPADVSVLLVALEKHKRGIPHGQ